MSSKMPIWDKRVIEVMEFVIANKIKCTNQNEFCKLLGIDKATIAQVKKNSGSSFRNKHILKLYQVFGVRPDFIYGLSNNMFGKPAEIGPVKLLEEALRQLKKK